jgi:hypothetical protein
MSAKSTVGAVIETIAATENHMRHEYSGDWDATLETVHPEGRYAIAQPGFSKVISGHAGVAAHYHSMEGVVVPHASRLVAQIATDWYMFFENFPTRVHVDSGEWRISHTATLAPTAPPLIKGEMLWERDPDAGDAAPDASVQSLLIHERFLDALRDGDGGALSAIIDRDAIWAERDYLSDSPEQPMLDLRGAAAAVDYCLAWRAGYAPERVSILNRIATSWYVFAEELWIVAPSEAGGPRRQLRKATIYPVTPAGTLKGAIGWGSDLCLAVEAAVDASFGAAFWEGQVVDHTPDPLLRGRAR